ncbi:MAG: HAD-IIIA family hydrolase [Candidatus Kapaibacterium sp.]
MNKCFFFDRDGIVNTRKIDGYIKNYNEFEFIPEFIEIFKKVDELGFLKVIITNQQGIGKGVMTEEELSIVHNLMQFNLYQKLGYSFDDIYYSPDLANSGSKSRKPEPGMILEAIEKWDIDKETSYFIGDSESDAIAGERAGIKTILIGNFSENKANFVFSNYKEFINNIENVIGN